MATYSSILVWRIPMDRGAWWATVCRVTKSWTHEQLNTAQHNIPLCICIHTHSIFIHSSVGGHLSCFCVLAIVNSASVNIGYMCLSELRFSQGLCPAVGHMIVLFLVFLRNRHTVLHSGYITLHSHQ